MPIKKDVYITVTFTKEDVEKIQRLVKLTDRYRTPLLRECCMEGVDKRLTEYK